MRKLLAMRFLVAVGSACVLLGCSEASEQGTTEGPLAGCAADTRKDVYAAGLTKQAGALSVRLVEASPGPLAKGMNTLRLAVADAAGAPLDGATVRVTPFMPDHGHGSARKTVVSPLGGGGYTVTDLWLAMAGLWRLTVDVETQAGTTEAVFQFCIDG